MDSPNQRSRSKIAENYKIPYYRSFVRRNLHWLKDFSRKGPVTRKALAYHDVIMSRCWMNIHTSAPSKLNIILTHWGRVTHICVNDLTIIGSDNGLSPGRRQAIIRTNAGILLIRPLGTNFSEFLVEILIFSFKKMRLKVSSAKRRPFCLGLNELNHLTPSLTHSVQGKELVRWWSKVSVKAFI